MHLLESQLQLKRLAEAHQTVRMLEESLQARDPRLFQVATTLALNEDYAAAVPLLERIHQALPQVYDIGYNLALAHYRSANYDKAVETLRSLTHQQDRAEVDNLLGLAEEKRKRYAEAVEAFRKAAESEPGNEDYRFDYADSVLQYRTSKEATAVFVKAVRDFPKSWKMRLGLGSSHYLTGDYEAAAQHLLEAVRLNPDSKLAFYLLGRAYESASLAQAAIAEKFRAYLERQPDDAWAYCHYGTILYLRATSARQVDFTSAKLYLNKSLALDPTLAEAYLELGIIALAEGQTQESVQLLERAVQLKPELAGAHYRLGMAYQRLERAEKAKAEMDLFKTLKTERDRMIEALAQRAH